mmetsp:Transcript_32051/g.70141  ORF Transcript_32051/g.70141 Transcript_32051/m.70141 type:complete len:290 (-) Transcript_32051:816-1685(-)
MALAGSLRAARASRSSSCNTRFTCASSSMVAFIERVSACSFVTCCSRSFLATITSRDCIFVLAHSARTFSSCARAFSSAHVLPLRSPSTWALSAALDPTACFAHASIAPTSASAVATSARSAAPSAASSTRNASAAAAAAAHAAACRVQVAVLRALKVRWPCGCLLPHRKRRFPLLLLQPVRCAAVRRRALVLNLRRHARAEPPPAGSRQEAGSGPHGAIQRHRQRYAQQQHPRPAPVALALQQLLSRPPPHRQRHRAAAAAAAAACPARLCNPFATRTAATRLDGRRR